MDSSLGVTNKSNFNVDTYFTQNGSTSERIQSVIDLLRQSKYNQAYIVCVDLRQLAHICHINQFFFAADKIYNPLLDAAIEFENKGDTRAACLIYDILGDERFDIFNLEAKLRKDVMRSFWAYTNTTEPFYYVDKVVENWGVAFTKPMTPEDVNLFIAEFIKAAFSGDRSAGGAYQLAKMYHDGKTPGFEQSDLNAAKFYLVAISKECPCSLEALTDLDKTTQCDDTRYLIDLVGLQLPAEIFSKLGIRIPFETPTQLKAVDLFFKNRNERPEIKIETAYILAELSLEKYSASGTSNLHDLIFLERAQEYFKLTTTYCTTAGFHNSSYLKAHFGLLEISAIEKGEQSQFEFGKLCIQKSKELDWNPTDSALMMTKGITYLQKTVQGKNIDRAGNAALILSYVFKDSDSEASLQYLEISAFDFKNKEAIAKLDAIAFKEFETLTYNFPLYSNNPVDGLKSLIKIANGTNRVSSEATRFLVTCLSQCIKNGDIYEDPSIPFNLTSTNYLISVVEEGKYPADAARAAVGLGDLAVNSHNKRTNPNRDHQQEAQNFYEKARSYYKAQKLLPEYDEVNRKYLQTASARGNPKAQLKIGKLRAKSSDNVLAEKGKGLLKQLLSNEDPAIAGEAARQLSPYYSSQIASVIEDEYLRIAMTKGNEKAIKQYAKKIQAELDQLQKTIATNPSIHLDQYSIEVNLLKKIANDSLVESSGNAAFILAQHYHSQPGKKVSLSFYSSSTTEEEANKYYQMSANWGNPSAIQYLDALEQAKKPEPVVIENFDETVHKTANISYDEESVEETEEDAEKRHNTSTLKNYFNEL